MDLHERPRALPRDVPYERDTSLPELFVRRAATIPDHPAVVHGEQVISYRELHEMSDGIASRLSAEGITPGTSVGVLGNRSWEATAAILGILKAGGVCVPFDAHNPPARTEAMLADARVQGVVLLPGQVPMRGVEHDVTWLSFSELIGRTARQDAPVATWPSAEQGAFVLFTSGTTGRPKPVLFPHRAVSRLAGRGAPWCAGPGGRVLQTFGLSFDGSLFETWATLLGGGALVVADWAATLDSAALCRLMTEQRVSHAFMTTSLFHHTVRARPEAFAGLEMVLTGGEVMDVGLARAVLSAGAPRYLINGYGPTEGGIMVTAFQVHDLTPDAVSVPIGGPVAGSDCHVLRADLTPVAPGEAGELLIGGDGLALGYLGLPEETDSAFVTARLDGDDPVRLYRSGDRARWGADGTLEFLGRGDRQVKIRGFRVELEAVERELRAQPEVAEAVVHVRGNDGIGKGLTAFVTPADENRPPDPARLSDSLGARLPGHSVPAPITTMPELPLTANGKIDHAALQAHTATESRPDDLLADIWARALDIPVEPDTNFFSAGGNSLLGAQVVSQTLSALNLDPALFGTTLQHLLAEPTLTAYRTTVHDLRHGTPGAHSAGATAVDHERQAALHLRPGRPREPVPRPRDAHHILLTGATGFVGAFLLERLLRHTDAVVHCPVRADDRRQAATRIRDNLLRHRLPPPDPHRVHAFPADLAEPRLGLAAHQFAHLADELDLIVHNGAHVNFLYPYQRLRASNVEGTRAVIELAMPRRVPLHHVSTTAVLAGSGAGGIRTVTEHTPLSHPHLISMGYAETKWVAERMLQHAAAAGLPVTVYRPYEITGHSRTGVWNTASAICAVFDAITELGLAPDVPLPLDLVPVDHVAQAIIGTAVRLPHLSGVLHLTNPRPARLGDMVRRMRAAGHRIQDVGYHQWVSAMLDHVDRRPDAAIAPFAPLFVTHANEADFSIKEMYFNTVFPAVERVRTDEVLPRWRADCPPVDDALLDHYLAYLAGQGRLTPGHASAPMEC